MQVSSTCVGGGLNRTPIYNRICQLGLQLMEVQRTRCCDASDDVSRLPGPSSNFSNSDRENLQPLFLACKITTGRSRGCQSLSSVRHWPCFRGAGVSLVFLPPSLWGDDDRAGSTPCPRVGFQSGASEHHQSVVKFPSCSSRAAESVINAARSLIASDRQAATGVCSPPL